MDNTVEKLDNITRAFEKQNDILQEMLGLMPRPGSKLMQALGIFALVAGALGILNAIDIARNWIMGG